MANKNIITKLPPQAIETEQALLGALLINKDALIKVADVIASSDFYRDDHAEIYAAILKLYEKRQPVDLVTLTEQLEKEKKLKEVGGASYLATLANSVSSAAHVSHYADIVHQKATLRRLISAATRITELGYEEEEEIEEVLDRAERELFAVSQKFLRQYFVPIKDILSESFDRIDELHKHKGKLRGLATGYHELDNLLAGLQKSDLLIIAGRPSMGKSSLALNIAEHVATQSKEPVGIFSLEMSKEQIIDRLLSSQAGVDAWKMRTGNLTDDDFPKIGYAMGVLSEAPIYIDDSPILNAMEIRTKARRLQADKGLSLIIVDYLQLMESSRLRESNRVQEVSDISRALKALARELNVPVIALSQLSRAVEARQPKIPQLADLRESGCLSGDALIWDGKNNRFIPIKDLVGRKNFICLALDRKGKLVFQKALKIFATGRKKVFELILTSGKKIKATANHQFLTIDGWKRLDQLKLKERIATPRKIISNTNTQEKKFSDQKIILLAHLIGDGCYLKNQPLHYTNSDKLCLGAVDKAASQEFRTKNRLVRQENWFHLYLSAPYPLARGRRNPIVRWLDEELGIFNQRAGEKKIPGPIFNLPLAKIALFLRHLFATDGSLIKSGKLWRLYYASKSRRLIEDVRDLLLFFEIHSRIKKTVKKGYEPTYDLFITGASEEKFLREIGIFGRKSESVKKALKELSKQKKNTNIDVIPKEIWPRIAAKFQAKGWPTRKFHQKMGWAYSGTQRYKNGLSRERLAKIALVLGDKELKNLAENDIFWDEIKEINPLGQENVYDITVPDTHNFLANSLVVHNSLEQDSDVVMFIYREDYYEKDTDRKNIADILIRKHRNGPIGQIELYFVPEQMRFRTIEKKRAESI